MVNTFSKENLTAAFKFLRTQGLVARQNFLCCGNCAGTQIAYDVNKSLDKGKSKDSIKGCVFYHRQDAAALRTETMTRWQLRRGSTLMIRFGQIGTEKYGDIGLSTVEVGKMVCAAFDQFGVPYTWDGNEMSCINVTVLPKSE